MAATAAHRRDNLAAALAGAATVAALWWWQRRREAASATLAACLERAACSPPSYAAPDWSRAGGGPTKELDKAAVHALRQQHFCGAQSVSYANRAPLMLVRGRGSKLYDEQDAEYLDTRNNVAHVGHSHPHVVAALATQAAQINTNTRYLHPNVVRLADRLLARCPKPLAKVFFVNSGSEANDLALRLARAFTGKQDVVCVEHAYHGHTCEVVQISPYKFAHPGGVGQREWVHVAAAPCTYRGPHRNPATAAALYARDVEAAVAAADAAAEHEAHEERAQAAAGGARPPDTRDPALHGGASSYKRGVAAFFLESGMSVAGVVLPPPGYAAQCFRAVRAAGGVCVADEVQVGLGRFGGDCFWGFQHGGGAAVGDFGAAVPDIVTVGKPFGNGMPLAAVVCTAEIAAAMEATTIEYFNTFGGNPVACAAGLATLDVLEREDLVASAHTVGALLVSGLRELAERHALIGDVRGCGLFLGVDFVSDRKTRQAAPKEASLVCSRLKEVHRVLTSLDGPGDNVLVLKPPLAFSARDAAALLQALDECLGFVAALGPAALAAAERTPT